MTLYSTLRKRTGLLEEYQSPGIDVLGAVAQDPTLLSTGMLSSAIELQGAMHGEPVGVGGFDMGLGELRAPTSPLIDAETARARIAKERLDLTVPDEGIRSEALDMLIERKSDERRRMDIINRGPSGVGMEALKFGTALGVSMMDPLNIASAFVPVVSQARYGAMIARFGKIKGRAMTGAIEGAAGAAMVEPFIAGSAAYLQEDYGMADSMLSIALGTALGGGLHVGTGAIGDAMARRANRATGAALDPLPAMLDELPFETREAALRTGVAQALSGRPIDVETVLRMGGMDTARFGPETRVAADVGEMRVAGGLDEVIDVPAVAAAVDAITPADVAAVVDSITPEDVAAVVDATPEDVAAVVGASPDDVRAVVDSVANATPDDVRAVVDGVEQIASDPDAVAALGETVARVAEPDTPEVHDEKMRELLALNAAFDKSIDNLDAAIKAELGAGRPYVATKGDKSYSVTPSTSEPGQFQITWFSNGEPMGHINSRPANLGREAMQVMGQDAVQKMRASPAPRPPVDIQAAARANHAPENVRLADHDASRAADERIAETPDDEAFPEASLEQAATELHETVVALGEAPEWAEIVSALPKDAKGRPDMDVAVRLMKDISGTLRPAYRYFTREQQFEMMRRVRALAEQPGQGASVPSAPAASPEARAKASEDIAAVVADVQRPDPADAFRDYLRSKHPLRADAIAKHLGITEKEASDILAKAAAQQGSRIVQVKVYEGKGKKRRVVGSKFQRKATFSGPVPLDRFIAELGGIRDERGDLKSAGLDKVFIPGVGPLVRAKGLSPDRVREAAVEAGYLQDQGAITGGVSESSLTDLFDALASGEPVYAAHELSEAMELQAARDSDLDMERGEHLREQVAEQIDTALEGMGMSRDFWTPEQLAEVEARVLEGERADRALEAVADQVTELPEPINERAVEIRMAEGLEPEVALEHAAIEAHYAEDGLPLRSDSDEEIAFDEAFPPFDPDRTAEERADISRAGDAGTGEAGPPVAVGEELRLAGANEGATTERTSIGDQFVIPGAGREGIGSTLQRRADQPMRASAEQRLTMDEGLFGEKARQQDIFDTVMQEVEQLAEAIGDPDLVPREMREAQALADSAEAYGNAVRAAANCRLRRT